MGSSDFVLYFFFALLFLALLRFLLPWSLREWDNHKIKLNLQKEKAEKAARANAKKKKK